MGAGFPDVVGLLTAPLVEDVGQVGVVAEVVTAAGPARVQQVHHIGDRGLLQRRHCLLDLSPGVGEDGMDLALDPLDETGHRTAVLVYRG